MITVEEIEKCYRNCMLRDFVNGKELACRRTRELPDFDEKCENFEKNEELSKMAPPKSGDFPVSMMGEELLAKENPPKGVPCVFVAYISRAVVWNLISASTGLQMGHIAIGIGFLAGFVMWQGKRIRLVFGFFGVALVLISCVLGDFLSIISLTAKDYDMTFFEVLAGVNYGEIFSIVVKNMMSMSALFYETAVYEGYKLSSQAQRYPVDGKVWIKTINFAVATFQAYIIIYIKKHGISK